MLANWKTTIAGVLALATVLWNAYTQRTINWNDLQVALIGIGLVAAKDFNVTGGTVVQK